MSQSYNQGGWLVFLLSVFFGIAWVLYFMVVQVPVDLGEESAPPPVLDMAQVDISSVQDYWQSSELMVQKGSQVYAVYCALCHGVQGKGDGIAGRGLKPPPRDFTVGDWKYGGTRINLFKVITAGSEGTSMAAFSHIPKKERWALVHFIRSLTQNSVKDEDAQTKEFAENAQ